MYNVFGGGGGVCGDCMWCFVLCGKSVLSRFVSFERRGVWCVT